MNDFFCFVVAIVLVVVLILLSWIPMKACEKTHKPIVECRIKCGARGWVYDGSWIYENGKCYCRKTLKTWYEATEEENTLTIVEDVLDKNNNANVVNTLSPERIRTNINKTCNQSGAINGKEDIHSIPSGQDNSRIDDNTITDDVLLPITDNSDSAFTSICQLMMAACCLATKQFL